MKTANFGIIGLSGRGSGMLREFLAVPGVNVVAVCDLYEDSAKDGFNIVKEIAGNEPAVYLDYKEMLKRDDIDAIFCATTWITHARIAVDSMRAGKHVGVEVGGAASVEECWQMVRASEETGKFCMILENCCYDRTEMAVFNMYKMGLFGEVVHLEGGYRHDLRDEISMGRELRHGRLVNFKHRCGDLYPTHQLGPICKLIDINRGNRLLTISSIPSKTRGLRDWIRKNKGVDDIDANYEFCQGDVVSSMIKCANGETITLHHDCSLPRPYSRDYVVQGTKGMYEEDKGFYLDTPEFKEKYGSHNWAPVDEIRAEYEHPIWKEYEQESVNHGHGVMNYL